MKIRNVIFRVWYYFRNGWATYFSFLLAAINSLTVTYYLAIEKASFLQVIFPTFTSYIVIIGAIGIPLLTGIGYIHFKKTQARKAEVDIGLETDPYRRRFIVNTEAILTLNLKMLELLLMISENRKVSDENLQEIQSYEKKLISLIANRSFTDGKDMDFIKKMNNDK
jgi:hypothetical protein